MRRSIGAWWSLGLLLVGGCWQSGWLPADTLIKTDMTSDGVYRLREPFVVIKSGYLDRRLPDYMVQPTVWWEKGLASPARTGQELARWEKENPALATLPVGTRVRYKRTVLHANAVEGGSAYVLFEICDPPGAKFGLVRGTFYFAKKEYDREVRYMLNMKYLEPEVGTPREVGMRPAG